MNDIVAVAAVNIVTPWAAIDCVVAVATVDGVAVIACGAVNRRH